jgi:hypothetical protein
VEGHFAAKLLASIRVNIMRGLPLDYDRKPPRTWYRFGFSLVFLVATALLVYQLDFFEERAYARDLLKLPVTCPAQSPAITPLHSFQPVDADYPSTAAARLSGAIQVRTETFDDSASSSNGVS